MTANKTKQALHLPKCKHLIQRPVPQQHLWLSRVKYGVLGGKKNSRSRVLKFTPARQFTCSWGRESHFAEVSKLLQVSDVDITNAINDSNHGWRIKDVDSRDVSVSSHTILSCGNHMVITTMAFTGFRLQFSQTFDTCTLLPSTSGFEPMLKSPMMSDSSNPASIRHCTYREGEKRRGEGKTFLWIDCDFFSSVSGRDE